MKNIIIPILFLCFSCHSNKSYCIDGLKMSKDLYDAIIALKPIEIYTVKPGFIRVGCNSMRRNGRIELYGRGCAFDTTALKTTYKNNLL